MFLSLRHLYHEDRLASISVNSSSHGYRDGVGDEAQFNLITGFTQINSSTVVVVDTESETVRS